MTESKVDVPFDGALNDAGWAFIEAMPVPLPGPIWNNLKPALKAAIEKWLEVNAALAPFTTGAGHVE